MYNDQYFTIKRDNDPYKRWIPGDSLTGFIKEMMYRKNFKTHLNVPDQQTLDNIVSNSVNVKFDIISINMNIGHLDM